MIFWRINSNSTDENWSNVTYIWHLREETRLLYLHTNHAFYILCIYLHYIHKPCRNWCSYYHHSSHLHPIHILQCCFDHCNNHFLSTNYHPLCKLKNRVNHFRILMPPLCHSTKSVLNFIKWHFFKYINQTLILPW